MSDLATRIRDHVDAETPPVDVKALIERMISGQPPVLPTARRRRLKPAAVVVLAMVLVIGAIGLPILIGSLNGDGVVVDEPPPTVTVPAPTITIPAGGALPNIPMSEMPFRAEIAVDGATVHIAYSGPDGPFRFDAVAGTQQAFGGWESHMQGSFLAGDGEEAWEYSAAEQVLVERVVPDGRTLWKALYLDGWRELCTAWDATTTGVAMVDDREAFVIACDPPGATRTLWVDAETGFVVRVLSDPSIPATPWPANMTVVALDPDPVFDPSEFVVNPPAGYEEHPLDQPQTPAYTPEAGESIVDMSVVAPADQIDAGDLISQTLTLSNAGDTILEGVVVSWPTFAINCEQTSHGDRFANDGTDTLDPGESIACFATRTLTAADLERGLHGPLQSGEYAPETTVSPLDGGDTLAIGGPAPRERPLAVYVFYPYPMQPGSAAVEGQYLEIFEAAYRKWGTNVDFVAVGDGSGDLQANLDTMALLRERFALTVPLAHTDGRSLWARDGGVFVIFDADNQVVAEMSSHRSYNPGGDGPILDYYLQELAG